MHGRVISLYEDGDRAEYEARDGKLDGKYIMFRSDGRVEREWKGGLRHGRRRQYDQDNVVTAESMWEHGYELKVIKFITNTNDSELI